MPRVLSTMDVAKTKLGVSRSTLYNLSKSDQRFPRPIKIGAGRIGYLEAEVDEYILRLAADRDSEAA